MVDYYLLITSQVVFTLYLFQVRVKHYMIVSMISLIDKKWMDDNKWLNEETNEYIEVYKKINDGFYRKF